MSGCILRVAALHSPVFLVNSCLDHFSAPRIKCEDPFSRSYGVNLPSSLTASLPSALVYSTRPRVSVYSTDAPTLELSGFSRRLGYPRYPIGPRAAGYCQVRLTACTSLRRSTPTPFNALFRQGAEVSLPRHRIAPNTGCGMLTACPSASAFALALGAD